MTLNKRGYIARKFYAHQYGAQTIYEENIFESYELAYKFIEEISQEDHDRFLSEIASYQINDDTILGNSGDSLFNTNIRYVTGKS